MISKYMIKHTAREWEEPNDEYTCLSCYQGWRTDDIFDYCPRCGIKFSGEVLPSAKSLERQKIAE